MLTMGPILNWPSENGAAVGTWSVGQLTTGQASAESLLKLKFFFFITFQKRPVFLDAEQQNLKQVASWVFFSFLLNKC